MKTHQLLLVDDNPINNLFIRQFLKETKWLIFEAQCVESAIDVLRNKLIHTIITDINLPVESGWDLLKLVKVSTEWAEIRVIGTSASAYELQYPRQDREQTSSFIAFDDILPKPFDEHQLKRILGV